MMTDFVPSVLVKAVALAGSVRIFWCCSGNFDQTVETAEERRVIRVQVQQHLIVWNLFGVMIPSSIATSDV